MIGEQAGAAGKPAPIADGGGHAVALAQLAAVGAAQAR